MRVFSLLNPAAYAHFVIDLCRLVLARRILVWELGKRELRERYAGQALGAFWAVLHPLLTISVYLFIFALVLRVRMPGGAGGSILADGSGSYVLYLLSGLIPWMSLQEVMNRSVGSVTGNAALVKQVIFPVEALPLKMMWPSLVSQAVALGLFLLYSALSRGLPSPLALLLPWLVVWQVILGVGLALTLASLAPFLRDLQELVGVFCFVMIYAMPVFYTPAMLPNGVSSLIWFNPLSHMIACYQDALYWGTFHSPWSWLVFPLIALVSLALGCRVFAMLKPLFGNVL